MELKDVGGYCPCLLCYCGRAGVFKKDIAKTEKIVAMMRSYHPKNKDGTVSSWAISKKRCEAIITEMRKGNKRGEILFIEWVNIIGMFDENGNLISEKDKTI